MLDEGENRTIGEPIDAALTGRIGTVVLILIAILIGVSIPGYLLEWKWTGLPGTIDNGPKTLWHWLDLLIVPMVLAGGAFWFKKIEEDTRRAREKKEKDAAESRRQEGQEIELARREAEASTATNVEEQRAQEAALETYFDRLSELLLDRDDPLLASNAGSACQEMAFVRTVTALRRLDRNRQNLVFEFLRHARLLGLKRERIITNDAGNSTTEVVRDPVSILERRNVQDIDLCGTNLSGANLRGTDLRKAKLIGADLSNAILHKAFFISTIMSEAKFRNSDMREARIVGERAPWGPNSKQSVGDRKDGWFDETWGAVELRHADLSGADLRDATIENATLPDVDLRGANLRGARMDRLTLRKTNLSGADLSGVDLSGTWMEGANLSGAKLSEANLSKVNLRGGCLRGADLREADLSEADLGPSKMLGQHELPVADLREVRNLTCAQLKQAKNWEEAYRDEELRCGADIPTPH